MKMKPTRIEVRCSCGTQHDFGSDKAGQQTTCCMCGAVLIVPGVTQVDIGDAEESSATTPLEKAGLRIQCSCGKVYEFQARHAGRTGRCKICGAQISVPDSFSDLESSDTHAKDTACLANDTSCLANDTSCLANDTSIVNASQSPDQEIEESNDEFFMSPPNSDLEATSELTDDMLEMELSEELQPLPPKKPAKKKSPKKRAKSSTPKSTTMVSEVISALSDMKIFGVSLPSALIGTTLLGTVVFGAYWLIPGLNSQPYYTIETIDRIPPGVARGDSRERGYLVKIHNTSLGMVGGEIITYSAIYSHGSDQPRVFNAAIGPKPGITSEARFRDGTVGDSKFRSVSKNTPNSATIDVEGGSGKSKFSIRWVRGAGVTAVLLNGEKVRGRWW